MRVHVPFSPAVTQSHLQPRTSGRHTPLIGSLIPDKDCGNCRAALESAKMIDSETEWTCFSVGWRGEAGALGWDEWQKNDGGRITAQSCFFWLFFFFLWRFEELIDYWFKSPGGKTLLELPLPLVGVVSNHLMFTLLKKKKHTRENGGKNNPIWKQFWIIFFKLLLLLF